MEKVQQKYQSVVVADLADFVVRLGKKQVTVSAPDDFFLKSNLTGTIASYTQRASGFSNMV